MAAPGVGPATQQQHQQSVNNPTLTTARNAQGQMVICPSSTEFANNKVSPRSRKSQLNPIYLSTFLRPLQLYGSSAALSSNSHNATNCHNSTFPLQQPPPPTSGAAPMPATVAGNNNSSTIGHNLNQQQAHKNGATPAKSYVPVVSPRTTSMPLPHHHPHMGLNSEFGQEAALSHQQLPAVQQMQVIGGGGAMPQKHHMLSPPLPIPSTGNNHFSPIQSPGVQMPGLPVIHSNGGQLHSNAQQQGVPFNAINSRLSGPRTVPQKVNQPGHQNLQQKLIFQEDQSKHSPTSLPGQFSTQPRAVRPKPPVCNVKDPVDGVEVIEHRQRKERLPLKDIEDLIHLSGPLTEDAVMKTLHTRFQNDSFYVS